MADESESKISNLKEKASALRNLAQGILGGDFQGRLLELAREYELEATNLAGARARLLGFDRSLPAQHHHPRQPPYRAAFGVHRALLARWLDTRDVHVLHAAQIWQRVAREEMGARRAQLALDRIVLRMARERMDRLRDERRRSGQ
jgi:hypothetical protein